MNHLLELPDDARVLLVLAHGAGAGMRHPFMERVAAALAARGVGTFRYEFEYMENKSRRPDAPSVAMARVREALAEAAIAAPGLPLLAGGKSFGGRMTSNAQAESPLPGVRGLAFLGFPLHPPGKPSIARADHLDRVTAPMLFVQGTRDEFAEPRLLMQVLARLGPRASLYSIEGGDHSFNVPKSTGRSKDDVLEELGEAITGWAGRLW
ncbi:MAG: alpha/beta family hydrolase [Gemmatimonadales bacterium]